MGLTVTYGLAAGDTDYSALSSLSGTGISPLNFDGLQSITNITSTSMKLNWTAEASSIAFFVYEVNGSTATTSSTVLNSSGTTTSTTISSLTPNTSYTFRVRAVDSLGTPESNEVDLTESTDAIGTFTLGNISTNEGVLGNLDLTGTCTDGDGNGATYSLVSQADADANCSVSGTDLDCTPNYKAGSASWSSTATVRCVINGSNLDQDVTINVANSNQPPVITAIADTATTPQSAINVDAGDGGDDDDADGDTLLYSCAYTGGAVGGTPTTCTSLPGTATFDTGTGVLAWTPNFGAAVSTVATAYTVTVTASDQQSTPLSDTEVFVVTVNPATTPAITITDSSPLLTTTVNLTWAATTYTYSDYCILENDTDASNCSWTTATLPSAYTESGTEGAVVLSAWIRDADGGIGSRADASSIVVDLNDPTWATSPTVSAWSNSTTVTQSVTYTSNAADTGSGVSSYEYAVGTGTAGGAINDVTDWTTAGASPFAGVVSGVSHGDVLYVNMRAVDGAGRYSSIKSTSSFTIDTVAPSVAVTYPAEADRISLNQFDFTGTCETGVNVDVTYSSDVSGNTTETCTGSAFTLTVTVGGAVGNRTVTTSQTDPAGNTGTVTRIFERIPEGMESIGLGQNFSCGVTTNGKLECWGLNTSSQLGDATSTNRSTPVETVGDSISTVKGGNLHGCAVTTTGGVKCWGSGTEGQLGDGGDASRTSPVDVTGLTGVTELHVGYQTTCAIASGGLKCWGQNALGEAGNGNAPTDPITPEDVTGLTSGVASVVGNYYSLCALTTGGAVKCWGKNNEGQLGDGTNSNSDVPVQVSGLTSGVASIHADPRFNSEYFCAVLDTGAAKCWGNNTSRQLGDGAGNSDSNVPVQVDGLTSGVSSIAAAMNHTCAVMTTGAVKCWGTGSHGQLGNGTTAISTSPVDVTGITNATKVIVGSNESCALLSTGGVKCWGYNIYGQLGDGSIVNQSTPVDVYGLTSGVADIDLGSDHFCAVTTSKGLRCWGENGSGHSGDGTFLSSDEFLLTKASDSDLNGTISKIYTNKDGVHTCVITNTGAVKCAGKNSYGQLGDNTTDQGYSPVFVQNLPDPAVSLSLGGLFSCAVTDQGGAYCWGYGGVGNLGASDNLASHTAQAVTGFTSGVSKIETANTNHRTCLITTTNDLYCFGKNTYGALGDGTTTNNNVPQLILPNIQQVVMNPYTVCALTTTGGVKCWGLGTTGELGNGASVSESSPVDVTGLTSGVSEIASCDFDCRQMCAVMTADGSVKCWGKNSAHGLLGNNSTTTANTPQTVVGVSDVADISMGNLGTCAATNSGTVYCWGQANYGGLGNGSTSISLVPVQVTGLTGATKVSVGKYHACAVKSDNSASCWGYNVYGTLGDGTTDNNSSISTPSGAETGITDIFTSDKNTCVLKSSSLYCAGKNNEGQMGLTPTTKGPVIVGSYDD